MSSIRSCLPNVRRRCVVAGCWLRVVNTRLQDHRAAKEGVDINAAVPYSSGERSVIAAAASHRLALDTSCPSFYEYETRELRSASIEVLQYLISHGAKLRVSPLESSPFNFLRAFVEDERPLNEIQLLLDSGVDLRDSSGFHVPLLELCLYHRQQNPEQQIAKFEFFFRQGAPVRHGGPLALLICRGGCLELIEEVLDAGADINAYSGQHHKHAMKRTPLQAAAAVGNLELVSMLLHKGAALNQRAVGEFGRTALQAACQWRPFSAEEEKQKRALVGFLIDNGADVNAPPAVCKGLTALQLAAAQGDMKTAVLLLNSGADLNALSGACPRGYCALDLAARYNRLDMVKFLLNAGALSYQCGSTGYYGAIEIAERKKYFAVADLIRDHLANYIPVFGANPQIWLARQKAEKEWTEENTEEDRVCDVCGRKYNLLS
jgi:ankyrin repeat protein